MSWTRVIKAAAMTVVFSILCLIPPGIHFVTGPLSPLIGGYFAGNRVRLRGSEAAIVGLILALVVGIPLPWFVEEFDIFPSISAAAVVFFAAIGALYFGVLGGVAAALGGRSAQS